MKNKQNKINLEDNIDLMDEYNNETIITKNNQFSKIEIKSDQKLAENQKDILKNQILKIGIKITKNDILKKKNNEIYENIKIEDYSSEDESEGQLLKLRNTKKKDIKFNIKRTSKTIDRQINNNFHMKMKATYVVALNSENIEHMERYNN
ncbi:hypothetical protein U3516DRAFT_760122 [Neocallimastix sp. 'constans']